ncbi:MAG: FtsX-like permease family protein, partial [Cellulomonadaceae bacterium]
VVALARGNLERNPRRSASTASALMIGMALVGAAATVAASTESSVAGIVDETVHADLILRGAQGDIPAGAADAASQVPGIARFDRLDYGPAVVDGEYTYVSAAEPGFFPDTMSVTTVAGDLSSFDRGDALASTTAADTYGWTVGQSLTVTAVAPSADGTTGAREVRLGAIFESQGLGVGLMVPEDVLDATMPAQVRLLNTVFVTVADDADPAQVRAGLTEAVAPYLVVSVQDQEEFTASLTSQVQQMLSILYALLALSIVIAVLGIVNSLALSIMERTREIGLERAVGLGRLQLAGVTVVESVMTALFGTTFGLAIGVGVASALPTVYADQGLSELVIPWGELGGMLGLAVVVGVLAALWPAVRAARLPVLTSIASE